MPKIREPHPDDLMTTGEAARVLGVSVDMARWLEREGRLPAQRTTTGLRLFRRGDVETLAAQRAVAKAHGRPKKAPTHARADRDRSRRAK